MEAWKALKLLKELVTPRRVARAKKELAFLENLWWDGFYRIHHRSFKVYSRFDDVGRWGRDHSAKIFGLRRNIWARVKGLGYYKNLIKPENQGTCLTSRSTMRGS